jgi:broad specificity phosphatase PhoE
MVTFGPAYRPKGEDEARALIPYFSRIDFSHVLTSPLQRARQTCQLIGLDRQAEIEPDLAEWNYGDYEGKLTSDIHKTRPGWNVFRDGCPNGETPADVSARADRLIARLAIMTGNVALFSHGQFGPALAARWIGLDVAAGQHLLLWTASLNILSYNPNHPEDRVIALWNATPDLFATPQQD